MAGLTFKIMNPEHSIAIQEALFDHAICWRGKDSHTVKHTEYPCLNVNKWSDGVTIYATMAHDPKDHVVTLGMLYDTQKWAKMCKILTHSVHDPKPDIEL